MKKFIDRMAEYDLRLKQVAVFGTYSGNARPIDRAVKKWKKWQERNCPT